MGQNDERRRSLGAFLRSHRERLAPAEAGLHGGSGRRRTPGLRREEVAHLGGISPTWYTWLEQGREVSVSPHALGRIAQVLHLTGAERAYLFELAQKRDPDSSPWTAPAPPPALLDALEAISAPAYLLDPLWRACGWNEAASRLFAPWLGSAEHNLLRFVFLDPAARQFICDWEQRARRLVAEFRADTARRGDDPEFRSLLAGLTAASPLFDRFWHDQAVMEREGGLRSFNHPVDGVLSYEQVTLRPDGRSGCKLVLLVSRAAAAGSPRE